MFSTISKIAAFFGGFALSYVLVVACDLPQEQAHAQDAGCPNPDGYTVKYFANPVFQNNIFDPHIEGPALVSTIYEGTLHMVIWKGTSCENAVSEASNANFRGVLNPFAATSFIEAGERICSYAVSSTSEVGYMRFVVQSL